MIQLEQDGMRKRQGDRDGNNERVVRKSFTWYYSGWGEQGPDSHTLVFGGIICSGLVAEIYQRRLI